MTRQDEITIKLYKALRNLASSVHSAGLDLGLKAEMSDSLDALQAAYLLVHALEDKDNKGPIPSPLGV